MMLHRRIPLSQPRALRGQHGWNLLELAVVLAFVGLLGAMLWQLTPSAQRIASALVPDNVRPLARAQQALMGHLILHARLPYAATRVGEAEATGTVSGWLPATTLGLPATWRIRYDVDSTLAMPATLRFAPALPELTGIQPPPPQRRDTPNGLDACMALTTASQAPTLRIADMAVAAVLRDEQADQATPTASLPLPGTGQSAVATGIAALGHAELAGTLRCAAHLNQTAAYALHTQAANSQAALAARYLRYQLLFFKSAQESLDSAKVSLELSTFEMMQVMFDMMLATAQILIADPGLAMGVAKAKLVMITPTAVRVALSLSKAQHNLRQATSGLTTAAMRVTDATRWQLRSSQMVPPYYHEALRLYNGGLLP